MLIGVMADTHDNLTLIEKAVSFFNEQKADFVIHAGDFVAPFSLGPLENLRCPWIGVFGNNDGEKAGLTKSSQGRIQPPPFELNLDGKKVVVVHDLEEFDTKELLESGAEIIVYGHSHESKVEMMDKTLLINPGEVGAWLSGRSTVVLLDTKTMEAHTKDLETD